MRSSVSSERCATSRRGATLTILAFALSIVLLSVAGYLMDAATRENQVSALRADRTKAGYLAEAGLEVALQALRRGDPLPDGVTESLGDGEFEVRIETSGQTLAIESTGSVAGRRPDERIRVTLSATAEVDRKPDGSRAVRLLTWETSSSHR